ncbi:YihY/virulence factor BrkB family protein [bacterium]|nr:MAG: YihY/virulence factor BrkB family protein [bacterium]
MYVIKALGRSVVDFLKDQCVYLSASISFFAILAIIPLSLLIVTFFGYLIGENQTLYEFALSRLIGLFPTVTEEITTELGNVITYKGISVFMVCIYSILSLQLFYSLEHAMNIIFRIPKRRHFLLFFLWSIFIMTLVIVFLLLSFTLSSVAGLLQKYSLSFMGLQIGSGAGILLRYITPFVMVLLTFTAIFIIVPRVKILWRNALAGAAFVTIMWELAKYFFTYYVKNVIHFGTIYGSLTTFILFLLWVYYSSSIFLLGAELVCNLERRP